MNHEVKLNAPERVLEDSREKHKRIRAFLEESGFTGTVITTREHFAWVTSGGNNVLLRNTSLGAGSIVITKDKQFLVAHSMDAERLHQEQAAGQGYELVVMRWYEGDIREKAAKLAGKNPASDTDFPGTTNTYTDFVDLHYPMTELEVERERWIGRAVDTLFTGFAKTVNPGEAEKEIASRFHCLHLQNGFEVDVLIVGADERCFQFRHPLPTINKLDKYLMLHTVARRWGLHCNLTRFVNFGEPPEKVTKVYDAAANVAARVLLSLEPGVRFSDILAWEKRWYAEQGYPEEWRNHFQGGPTGYVIADAARCFTDNVVQVNQPYEWFITVTGAKMGELSLLTRDGMEIPSLDQSEWPKMKVKTELGEMDLPDIYTM